MNDSRLVSLDDVECLRVSTTGKAIRCRINGEEHWIPVSQIDTTSAVWDDERNNKGTLVVTRWIAEQKGLVPT